MHSKQGSKSGRKVKSTFEMYGGGGATEQISQRKSSKDEAKGRTIELAAPGAHKNNQAMMVSQQV